METETKPHAPESVESSRLVLRVVFSGTRPVLPQRIVRIPSAGTPLGRDVARGLLLDDGRLSRHHATIELNPDGGLAIVDRGSKNGTYVNACRVERRELAIGDVISVGDSCLVVSEEPPDEGPALPSMLGDSAAMRRARTLVQRLAATSSTVLLVAETGSGKEVVARALHDQSGLKGAFVPVNCAAIPEALFESQVFGHVAGAFTGAAAHTGFFRSAAGGTLFLDEIGEMPLAVQPKLLRALEERAVVPVGATRAIPCSVRIVAATNRNLPSAVERGTFRPDLLARLFEANVPLPPLRERREDILSLFEHALGVGAPAMTHALAEALLLHSWPFNVREVLATARDMAAGSRAGAPLEVGAFRRRVSTLSSPPPPRSTPTATRRDGRSVTPNELRSMLAEAGGTVAEVARASGRSRRQVYRWLAKYGIRIEEFRR